MTQWRRAVRDDLRLVEPGNSTTRRAHFKLRGVGSVVACLIGAVFIVELSLVGRVPPQEVDRMWLVEGDEGLGTTSLAVSSTGSLVATTDTAGRVSLLDEAVGWRKESLDDFQGRAMSVAFTSDSRFLAIAGTGFGIALWDREQERNEQFEFLPFQPGRRDVKVMTFTPDGRRLAIARIASSEVVVWDRAERRERRIRNGHAPILSLAISPDSRYLAAGEASDRPSIYVWDLVSDRDCLVLDGFQGAVKAMAFSPEGALLAAATMYERDIRLLDLSSGRLRRVISGRSFGTNALAFSPDGAILASGGDDGMVRLWMVSTGDQRAELDARAGRLNCVAFSPNGRLLVATASADDDIRFWKLNESLVDGLPSLKVHLHRPCDSLTNIEKALPGILLHRPEPLGNGPYVELSGPQRSG